LNTRFLANGLLASVLVAASGMAMAQAADQPPGRTAEFPRTGPHHPPGTGGPSGENPGGGMMGGMHGRGGMHGGGMQGRSMQGGGMKDDCPMMTGGMRGAMGHGMMGGSGMMGHLPPGNEKLAMRMHGEIMVAIGQILIKNADNIQPRPSN